MNKTVRLLISFCLVFSSPLLTSAKTKKSKPTNIETRRLADFILTANEIKTLTKKQQTRYFIFLYGFVYQLEKMQQQLGLGKLEKNWSSASQGNFKKWYQVALQEALSNAAYANPMNRRRVTPVGSTDVGYFDRVLSSLSKVFPDLETLVKKRAQERLAQQTPQVLGGAVEGVVLGTEQLKIDAEKGPVCLYAGHLINYTKKSDGTLSCDAPQSIVNTEACLNGGSDIAKAKNDGNMPNDIIQCNTLGLSNDANALGEGKDPVICVWRKPFSNLADRCISELIAWLHNTLPVGMDETKLNEVTQKIKVMAERYDNQSQEKYGTTFIKYCDNNNKVNEGKQASACHSIQALLNILKDDKMLISKIIKIADGNNSKQGRAIYQYQKERERVKGQSTAE